MAQPVLPGRVTSWTGVWRDGSLLAFAAKERLEMFGASRSPASVSSTASVQRIIDEQPVHDTAVAACMAVSGDKPHGVLMVDMRHDADDRPWVTEINAGRFGTTSDFWRLAGLNLVSVYLDAATGAAAKRAASCVTGATQLRDMDMDGTVVLEPGMVFA